MTGHEFDPDDAGQLRDLADRIERAAATARRIAPDNPQHSERLTAFASLAAQTVEAARAIATAVDPDGDND